MQSLFSVFVFDLTNAAAPFAPVIGAAGLTLGRFVKNKGRVPNEKEYWSLVITSSLIYIVPMLPISTIIVIARKPYIVSDETFIIVIVVATVIVSIIGNMIG